MIMVIVAIVFLTLLELDTPTNRKLNLLEGTDKFLRKYDTIYKS